MPGLLLRGKDSVRCFVSILVCLIIIISILMEGFSPGVTNAADLKNRFIAIGTSRPGAVTTHDFTFDMSTAGTLGSIKFEYCANSPIIGDPCVAPTGLDVSAASLDNQTGETGFAIDPLTTSSTLLLSRTPSASTAGTVNYDFGNITNPTGSNISVYVRVSTYASNDASGPMVDKGSVVFALLGGLGVGAFVPPWVVLCVGATVSVNCQSLNGSIRDLGNLSSTATRYTTTQFSVGTNDVNGYSVYVLGTTLTSGNNTIPALSTSQASKVGIGQFGLNLVPNTKPPVGASAVGAGTGTAASGYNQPNNYKFQTNDLVASSPLSTDFNLFTVSYIANIKKTQPPGIYDTTLTYLGVTSF